MRICAAGCVLFAFAVSASFASAQPIQLPLMPAARVDASCQGSSGTLGTGNIPADDPDRKGSTIVQIWFFARQPLDPPLLWAYETFNKTIWLQANATPDSRTVLPEYLGALGEGFFERGPGLANAVPLRDGEPTFDQVQKKLSNGGIGRWDCFNGTYHNPFLDYTSTACYGCAIIDPYLRRVFGTDRWVRCREATFWSITAD